MSVSQLLDRSKDAESWSLVVGKDEGHCKWLVLGYRPVKAQTGIRSKFRATVRSLAKGTQPEELAGALAEEPAARDRGGPAGSGDF